MTVSIASLSSGFASGVAVANIEASPTATAGAAVLVAASLRRNGGSGTVVSGLGLSWSKVCQVAAGSHVLELWAGTGTAAAGNISVANPGGSFYSGVIHAAEAFGADPATPVAQFGIRSGTGSAAHPVSLPAPPASSSAAFAAEARSQNYTFSPADPFVKLYEQNGGSGSNLTDLVTGWAPPPSPQSASFGTQQLSSMQYGALIVEIQAALPPPAPAGSVLRTQAGPVSFRFKA